MGKISKWFKALLLGFKKNDSFSSSSSTKKKKKWIDVKSYEDEDFQHYDDDDKAHYYYGVSVSVSSVHGQNEAGVDLANDGEVHSNVMMWNGEEWAAAVVIQSYFRAYLSRRALRALKGLVKLQALVRGHIVRKQTADMLRRMQALIRAQSRARAGRSQVFESPRLFSTTKSTQFLHHGLATPDKFEQIIRARSMKNDQMFTFKRNSSNHMGNRMDKTQGSFARNGSIDDENIVKILEIDIAKQRNLFHSSELSYNSDQFCFNNDETCYTSVDNSPQSRCSRSKTGPLFTQTKSGCSDDNHPNYMSYTEAAKAKTRSMSAPKLRPQYDHKRYSRSNMQNGTNFYANFTSKGNYQGSGRLDKIGMPA